MESKKSLLLNEIIREYLKQQEPIGSESLRLLLGIKISSATIRNHFKRLVEEGSLSKPHISSGRIPTEAALKRYWRERLAPQEVVHFPSLVSLERGIKSAGIFGAWRFYRPYVLREVLQVEGRFLLLDFERGEVALRYSGAMERFLSDLIGLEARDICNIARQLCIHELRLKLTQLLESEAVQAFGVSELARIAAESPRGEEIWSEILQGKWLDSLETGIYFEPWLARGNLALIQNISVEGKPAKLMLAGALCRDYGRFYEEALPQSHQKGESA